MHLKTNKITKIDAILYFYDFEENIFDIRIDYLKYYKIELPLIK
ncbi:Uncharacterized protein YR821_1170 [Yersinia ruckeri]|nr:hypothetical protein yruck0001_18870 [Yersinia ruckeri ATCC 29473]QTD76101.1 Uncharacterized protein YR821_1170 [Yersinia ruckeri]